MHPSAFNKMKSHIDNYLPVIKSPVILDFGSKIVPGQKLTHKSLFSDYNCKYTGLDLEAGNNVDVVMKDPYSIPFGNNTFDVIITGQVIEHIPFLWATFLELARILKPNGYIFCSAPSRGHQHNPPYDCWRFYPDSYKALAVFSNLCLVEVETHFPARKPNIQHFDYSHIKDSEYWGDTVGVFQKVQLINDHSDKDNKFKIMANAVKDWANQQSDIVKINSESVQKAKGGLIKHGKFDVLFRHIPAIMTAPVKKGIETGSYEFSEATAALKYLVEEDRVLELGGGLGFMSTVTRFCKLDSYTVIEADPRLIPIIKETHKINSVENVVVENCIATSCPDSLKKGYCMLQLGFQFWGSTIKNRKYNGEFVKISAIPLADFLENLKPTALIIDIEGGEIDLFINIDISTVNLIIMEVHPDVIGNDGILSIINELSDQGLSVVEKLHRDVVLIFKRY
jgi:FkbM family methyltransferase